MAQERWTGENAKVSTVELETTGQIEGSTDGVAITTAGWYYIDSINYSTGGITTGLSTKLIANHLHYLTTADSMTQSSAASTSQDVVTPMDFTVLTDVYSYSLSASRSEFDVTTLDDDFMVYEYGKTDLTGSLSGIRRLSVTDKDGGIINNFYDIVHFSTDNTLSYRTVDNDEKYFALYEQKDTSALETESFYFVKAKVGSYEPTADLGSRQEYTANFRVAGGDKPALYQRTVST